MMKGLGLEEEDPNDVIFQQETNVPTEAILWMSIACVDLFWARIMAEASPSYVKADELESKSMMKELGLEDEDLDDVVVQHDTNVPMKAIL